jgi:hypothetical protein
MQTRFAEGGHSGSEARRPVGHLAHEAQAVPHLVRQQPAELEAHLLERAVEQCEASRRV